VARSTPAARRGLLELLDAHDRSELIELGQPRRYRRGSRIVTQGDRGDAAFVLLEGRVKVTIDTVDGREIVLSVLGGGDLFGEWEAIDTEPRERAAGVVALQPVLCRVVTAEDFRGFLGSHPDASLALVRWIIGEFTNADRRRIHGTLRDTPHRLADFLLELSNRGGISDGDAVDVDIPLAQHELASLIGVSRNSVVRALATLRTHRLVTTTRHRITIRDLGALRRYVT
jgi:CRP/FNR family transcriptional regulator, cyclic AMP receptor protein